MLRERELIALGGLLHDIGKFVQRARDNGFQFKESEEELNGRLSWNKFIHEKPYVYEHAYLSTVFSEWLERKEIFTLECRQKLDRWGARHHNPTDELESVICQISDWYSSSEREAFLRSHINLLHSVFERISLAPKETRKAFEDYAPEITDDLGEATTKSFGFYNLTKLEADRTIFPTVFRGGFIRQDRDLIIQAKDPLKEPEGNYKSLFESFLKEFGPCQLLTSNRV